MVHTLQCLIATPKNCVLSWNSCWNPTPQRGPQSAAYWKNLSSPVGYRSSSHHRWRAQLVVFDAAWIYIKQTVFSYRAFILYSFQIIAQEFGHAFLHKQPKEGVVKGSPGKQTLNLYKQISAYERRIWRKGTRFDIWKVLVSIHVSGFPVNSLWGAKEVERIGRNVV